MADEIKANVPLDAVSNPAAVKASGSQGETPTGEHSASLNVVADAGSNDTPRVSSGAPAIAGAPLAQPAPKPIEPIAMPPVPVPTPHIEPAGIPQPLLPDPIAEEVGLARGRSTAEGLVKPTAVPPPPPPPPQEVRTDADMTKILSEVQLPERREFKAAADVKAAPPPVPPAPKPEPAPQPKPKKDLPLGSVHTLKQDLQSVVRDQKMSLVHAASLEQEKKRIPESIVVPTPASSRTRGILFTIGLLTALGFAALGGVYYVMTTSIGSAPPPQNSLVFAEQTYSFPLGEQSPTTVRSTLAQARNASNAALGSITRVVPTVATDGEPSERQATFSEFMSALGTQAPAELVRALEDEFFFGIHTVDENAPLIVVPVASYDRAFAGMLAWEKSMNADLSPLFVAVPALVLGTDDIPSERTFTDLVMRNYDVRALKDNSGTIQLYYSFPTRDLLIIAESPYTFTELLSRLQAERRL